MIRVDVRVSCDTCGADTATAQTYVQFPASDAQAVTLQQSLSALVHRAIWDAARGGTTITPSSARCPSCAQSTRRTG